MANIKRTMVADKNYSHRGRVVRYEGIYLGYVKDNTDAQRMGRLLVWVPDFGSLPDDEDSWVSVSYVSPFAGATDPKIIDNNPQKAGGSQTSYGWWAVPPDLENQVIVSFINGDPSRGVWLGCLYQQFMNHMVPGAAAAGNYQQGQDVPVAEYNKKTSENIRNDITRPELTSHSEGLAIQGLINDSVRGITYSSARRNPVSNVYGLMTPGPAVPTDPSETSEEIIPGIPTDSALPGGLSEKIPSSAPDPSKYAGAMPDIQGKIGDALAGISNPIGSIPLPPIIPGLSLGGPALPSVPNIPLPSIPSLPVPGEGIAIPSVDDLPKVEAPEVNTDVAAGAKNKTAAGTTSKTKSQRRKGGWQFYFDDEESNEHMRIRSRNGSQLLIDDTNGIVYAINRAGTSWIQMDAEGNFDIFAAKSVSVRSQEDINLRADRDFNIEAGRNIKVKATNDFIASTDGTVGAEDEGDGGGNIRIEALKDMQVIAKRNHNTQVTEGGMTTLLQAGSRTATIAGTDSVKAAKGYLVQSDASAGINVADSFVIQAGTFGLGSDNLNVETSGKMASAGDIIAGGEVYGVDVKTLITSLNTHEHKYIDSVGASATPVLKDTISHLGGGGSSSAVGPSAGEVPEVNAFDPAPTNSKTNVLATFSDDENLTRDTQDGVVTLVGRFLTYEPCPEHVNKGSARDDSET